LETSELFWVYHTIKLVDVLVVITSLKINIDGELFQQENMKHKINNNVNEKESLRRMEHGLPV